MADRVAEAQRSWNMSRIRSKDTRPERVVRAAMHAAGFRFRLHLKDLPGHPDLVLPKWRTILFVHGCFWHGHSCADGHIPKSRISYWGPKIAGNAKRDARNVRKLRRQGWHVFTVWECQTQKDVRRIIRLLRKAKRSKAP
jgi:DNA mismatch endonuclease (patch repair protein)